MPDATLNLGDILKRIFLWTLVIEASGAALIYLCAPGRISPYSSIFHAVSAFCNAGFSLNRDSLMSWQDHWGVNLVFMALIILGGLGFSVIIELNSFLTGILSRTTELKRWRFSWHTSIVLKTSLFLVLFGWAAIFLAEFIGFQRNFSFSESILTSLFQSVTCRTAGFNSLDIGRMTNVSLLIMIVLMFIGGAPGSCAGGIKVTTFRVLHAFIATQLKGRHQSVIGRYAVDRQAVNRALILVVFAAAIIFSSIMILLITEGGDVPHPQTRGLFMELMFEVVSAFGTVGLTTGLTPRLSLTGKWIITTLMFIGRLGPLIFLAAIQDLRREQFFKYPEETIQIG